MEIIIRSSDPDEIDVGEVKACIEARGYLVHRITIERITHQPTARPATADGETTAE